MVLVLLLSTEQDFREGGKGETVCTVTEAASYLGVLRQSVLKMVKTNRLTPAAVWDGKLLFKETDVRRLKEQREQLDQESA